MTGRTPFPRERCLARFSDSRLRFWRLSPRASWQRKPQRSPGLHVQNNPMHRRAPDTPTSASSCQCCRQCRSKATHHPPAPEQENSDSTKAQHDDNARSLEDDPTIRSSLKSPEQLEPPTFVCHLNRYPYVRRSGGGAATTDFAIGISLACTSRRDGRLLGSLSRHHSISAIRPLRVAS